MCRGGLAEREGFEPSMQVTPHGGLANRCTRPLCDLSVATAAEILTWAPERPSDGRATTRLRRRLASAGALTASASLDTVRARTWTTPSTFDARHDRSRSLGPGARVVSGERGRGRTSAFFFSGRPTEETPARCSW